MKRAIAFLVFGPTLAASTAFLAMAQAGGSAHGFAKIFAIAVFFFTLPVSAIAGCVDGVLNDAPASLRAALTAGVGAFVASALAFVLFGWLFASPIWAYFAFGGAACMGACSLLANECGRQRFADSVEA